MTSFVSKTIPGCQLVVIQGQGRGANGRTTGLILHEGGTDTYLNRVK